nr:protein C10 [Loxodonta africana]
MASASAQPAALSAEQAKVVLAEVIQAFSAPENAVRMDEARDNACNDMGKMLQFVLPVATQIQQEVIKAYGFSCDGEGVLKFARLVKSYEAQDPEIASLSGKLKALFLPPMTLPPQSFLCSLLGPALHQAPHFSPPKEGQGYFLVFAPSALPLLCQVELWVAPPLKGKEALDRLTGLLDDWDWTTERD